MNDAQRHDLFITSVWTKKLANFKDINEGLLKNIFSKSVPLHSSANTYGGQEATFHYHESLQEVLNHPKIDGSMAIAVPAKKVSSPKVTAPAGDMVSKLKKLKKLYDAELISEEEYKEKKKDILGDM